MTRSAREVLLEEARDRHKLELVRYTEAHTRVGVHLAVLAVFALTLLRFVDKLPEERGTFLFCLFSVFATILLLATLVVFVLVLLVFWGYGTRFPANMQTWLDQAARLRAARSGEADAEQRVAEDLEQHLMESMCETADHNAAKNALRSKFIVYASRGLVVAAGAFVISGVTYLYLSIGKDTPSPVRIAAPVQVQLQGSVQVQPVQIQGPLQLQPVQIQGPMKLQGPIQGREHGREVR